MTSTLLRAAAIAAAATALLPAAASAKKDPVPAPAPSPVPAGIDCFTDPAVVAQTADDVFVNQAGQAGCIGVRNLGSSLRLAFVVTTPGWNAEVLSNGDGTASRIQVRFTQQGTGRKVDARIEFGKTIIS